MSMLAQGGMAEEDTTAEMGGILYAGGAAVLSHGCPVLLPRQFSPVRFCWQPAFSAAVFAIFRIEYEKLVEA